MRGKKKRRLVACFCKLVCISVCEYICIYVTKSLKRVSPDYYVLMCCFDGARFFYLSNL